MKTQSPELVAWAFLSVFEVRRSDIHRPANNSMMYQDDMAIGTGKAGQSGGKKELGPMSLEDVLLALRLEARRIIHVWGGPIDGSDEDDLMQYLVERLLSPDRSVLAKYDANRGAPVAFMRTYARRRLIDRIRTALRRQELAASTEIDLSAATTPAEWVNYLQTGDTLIRHLRETCSKSDFEIFEACFLQELSNQEVGRRRNVEAKVIATRKHALLKKIRGFLRAMEAPARKAR